MLNTALACRGGRPAPSGCYTRAVRKLTHVPSAMESAADPEHIKIIRDVYGSRAQTIINALLAFDAFFAWYYPLKNHSLKLFDTDTVKLEQRALDNCRSAIDMHESFERLTMAGNLGHKSFLAARRHLQADEGHPQGGRLVGLLGVCPRASKRRD